MASMSGITDFVVNPFGLSDAAFDAIDYQADALGFSNKRQIDAAKDELDKILAQANAVSAQNKGLYDDYYGKMAGLYGEGAASYADAVKRLSGAIGEGPDSFTYTGGDVSQFLDPARAQRVAAATEAINNAASAGGNRFSSNYMDKLAAKQQALASEEWKEAYNKMVQDRQQQLQEWQTGQTAKQNYLANLGTVTNLYGNDRSKLGDALGDYYTAMANQNNADLQSYSDVLSNKANLESQKSTGVGSMLSGVGTVIGAMFG